MNVYDFDKTVYNGDSTIDFYMYCVRQHKRILMYLPKQVSGFLMYKMGLIEKVKFKEMFFSFLRSLKDVDNEVKCFWNDNIEKINSWYLEQKKEDDLIISASPDFIVIPALKRLNVNGVCSVVEQKTGKFLSKNCYGEEKVERFSKLYDVALMDEFYSDSLSDLPMAKCAKKAFLVKKGKVSKWNIS